MWRSGFSSSLTASEASLLVGMEKSGYLEQDAVLAQEVAEDTGLSYLQVSCWFTLFPNGGRRVVWRRETSARFPRDNSYVLGRGYQELPDALPMDRYQKVHSKCAGSLGREADENQNGLLNMKTHRRLARAVANPDLDTFFVKSRAAVQ